MSPCRDPSGLRRTALQAAAMRTVGDIWSSRSTVPTLCGILIRAPRMFSSVITAFRKAGQFGAWQPIGTTTASMPAV